MALLRKQKSLYDLDDKEKSDLTDIVLVAINEVTKSDPSEVSRYDVGVDISNMPPFNPYVAGHILQDLGYDEPEDGIDTNGWEHDYWDRYTHPDSSTFPPMMTSGTAFIHECHINGHDDDDAEYPHLEDNPEYAERIKHGYELLKQGYTRPKETK